MPLGGLCVLAVASVASGVMAANASKEAAGQAADAANHAAELQQQRFEESKAMMAPWTSTGAGALKSYSDFMGLNGKEAQAAAMNSFQTDPYFQQTLKNTADATQAQASARGVGLGGNVLDALYKGNAAGWHGQYNNYLNNLSGISQQGLSAGGVVTGAGTQAAANQGNYINQAGQATAAGTMGSANATGGAMNNLGMFAMLGGMKYNSPSILTGTA